MFKRLMIVVLGLILGASAGAQVEEQPGRWLEGSVDVSGTNYPYRLLKPPVIEADTRYPLLVFLHGAGERGNDNTRQLKHLPAWLAENPDRWPGYVLAPQCPTGSRWVEVDWAAEASAPLKSPLRLPDPAMRAVLAALGETLRDHPIDEDRIALTGLSMGGYGAWYLATRHPNWFCAVAPICGGGDERWAHRLAGVPLFVVHGDSDKAVPVVRSRAMVKALREVGANPRYDEIEGGGHDVWTQTYRGPDFWPWVASCKRSTNEGGIPALAALRGLTAKRRPTERVAFFGDSITQAGARPGGYVDLIAQALAALDPPTEVIPAGISGNRVPDLLARVDEDVLAKKPSLVFVFIGINDVWHSTRGKGTPIEEYKAGLHTLVRRIKESGADVILATPTVIGEKAAGENALDAMLDEYALASKRVALEEGVMWYDLRVPMTEHLTAFNSRNLEEGVLTTDGVHLNPAGNRFLAEHAALAIAAVWHGRK
ncbi:MAG: dienelactone hydrolase family protein [Planctomycetes bacterium]|nr:dienelactone hydrolase family protein [Planctomycetota bacterium]